MVAWRRKAVWSWLLGYEKRLWNLDGGLFIIFLQSGMGDETECSSAETSIVL